MKNYLFAPFKDDEDKIESFEDLKSQLSYYIDKNNVDINLALNPITIFIGCLESYYDVIISELRSKNAVAVADERIIEELRAEIKLLSCNDECQDNINSLVKLQAENKELNHKLNESKCGGVNQ